MQLNLSSQSIKFIKKTAAKHAQQIIRTLNALKELPIPHDAKLLKGVDGYYRVDIGEYRIIYRINNVDSVILISLIGKRNDSEVYKQFKRMQ